MSEPTKSATSSPGTCWRCAYCQHRFHAEIAQRTRIGRGPGQPPASYPRLNANEVTREALRCPACGSRMVHAVIQPPPANRR